MAVSCGGAIAAEIKQGAYFAINVGPGQYTLVVDKGGLLTLGIRSGEELFVRLDWNYKVGRAPIPVLNKISENDARGEIKFLSYIDAKRVHSSQVPRTDPSPVQPQLLRRGKE